MYGSGGIDVNYVVTSSIPDDAFHTHTPSAGGTLSQDPASGNYQITSIGLTAMDFDIVWLDAEKPEAKGTVDSDDFKDYLIANFTLKDENGVTIPFTADQIELTDTSEAGISKWTVKINGLVDISDNSTAKVYEISQNNPDSLPLVEGDGSDDSYISLAANPGVHSAVTDRVFEGGTLSMLLYGKRDFSGTVEWRDLGACEDRKAATQEAARIVVWRYVDTGNASDIESSAQVETISIPGTQDSFNFRMSELQDKYDNKGRRYIYYAKENILVGDKDEGTEYEKYYKDIHDPQNYLLDGETVYNKLGAKSIYSVDLKWIAAARQGGDASAVFELQRRMAGSNDAWTAVPGDDNGEAQQIGRNGQPVYDSDGKPVMVSASMLTIDDFKAEAMEIKDYFPEVPNFDDNGNRYEYRVVQKSVSRRDQNNGPDAITHTYSPALSLEDGNEQIKIGQDKYIVAVSQPQDPDTGKTDTHEFDFTYTLIGDIKIKMVKVWHDPEPKAHDDVKFQIYRSIPSIGTGNVALGSLHVIGSDENWTETVTIADGHFDDLGHEYEYTVTEIGANRPDYYSTYQLERAVDTDGIPMYIYTVNNIPTGEGDPRYIGIRKEWIDDGELEFREPITIRAKGDWISEDPDNPGSTVHNTGVFSQDQSKVVSEGTAWQTFFNAHTDYAKAPNVHIPSLFSEHMDNTSTGDYWTIDDIKAAAEAGGSELHGDAQWIYQLLSSKYYVSTDTNDVNYVQEDNHVAFNDLVGIYKNDQHYYAVQQIWNPNSSMNGMDGELVFRNTRIGVVSLKIHLDWRIGDDLQIVDKIKIRVSGNGNEFKDYEIPTRKQVYENNHIIEDYYILNLPKYAGDGKIIDYKVEEVELKDTYGNDISVTNGRCIFNGKKCLVNITQDTTLYGDVSHTDDLLQVILTNQYVDSTEFTAHKMWHDNSGKYYTRSDLYIDFYRISSAPNATEEKLGNEYLWIKNDSDTINYWTYHFASLDKYDEFGYDYTYYIKEKPVDKYRTVYNNQYDDVEEGLRNRTDAAYNGGVVHNYLHDEVVIKGDKLWQNVSSKVTPENYPVATVKLYVGKLKDGSDTEYEPDASKEIARTDIFNGQKTFAFLYNSAAGTNIANNYLVDGSYAVHNADGTVKTDGDNNIILPKYDGEGYLIKYVLDEVAINGYAFRISNQKIINDYHGGNPVKYTVHKNWNFKGENAVYPDIKVVLRQSFMGKNPNGEPAEITFNTYEARLTAEANWTYTFGVKENLRQYAPNGTDFIYSLSEVLSNYDSEDVPVTLSQENDEGLGFVYTSTLNHETKNPDTADVYEQYNKEITNTYDPQKANFNGKLEIDKSWDNQEEHNQNNAGEFAHVSGYTFMVSRRTRKIAEQNLFIVKTKDSYEGGQVPQIESADGSPLTAGDIGSFTWSEEKQAYIAQVTLDYHTVTVTVNPNGNSVHIEGLAIYARDAVRYDYKISESSRTGYIPVLPQSKRIAADDKVVQYQLKNVLDTVEMRLNKRFGAKDNSSITELNSAHFCQFFDDEYLKKLEFELYRRTEPADETDTETGWTRYDTLSGEASGGSGIAFTLDEANNEYYYVFRGLPKYSPEGSKYQYRVKETKNGGEISGQTSNLVTTQYQNTNGTDYSAEYTYNVTGAVPEASVSGSLTAADTAGGETPSFTVRNNFPASIVTLKKVWDDNDNADGMRPGRLSYTVYEKIPDGNAGNAGGGSPADIEITVDETLTGSTGDDSWTKTVPLPQYYFNGGLVDGLQFKLDETLTDYQKKTGYTLDDANSDISYTAIPADRILKLTNKKDQINGSITLTKTWPQDNGWGLQPDTVYFKLKRRRYYTNGIFSEYIGDYNGSNNNYPVQSVPSPYNQEETVTGIGTNDVIAVTKDSNGNYSAYIDNLPIGESIGGSSSKNGEWYGFIYRFVECDAAGNEYIRSGDENYSDQGDTFAFKWEYTDGVWESSTGKDVQGRHLIVAQEGQDAFKTAHRDQGIENTLKTTSYGFEKVWYDEHNLYNTRKAITVQLERKLETEDDTESNWKPVSLASSAPDSSSGVDTWHAVKADTTDTEAVQAFAASADTQTGVFDNLPVYNEAGVMYHYRVKELKFGTSAVSEDTTYHSKHSTASLEYYVEYDDLSDPMLTQITNTIIKYEHSQIYKAEKNWNDKGNLDGKRPEQLTVYLVQIKGTQQSTDRREYPGILNEENDWKYEWHDYPAHAPDGDPYYYEMREGDTPLYQQSWNHIDGPDTDPVKWEEKTFTNTHNQIVKSLTVDKDWLNELTEEEKRFRPESIEYELWCKYTTYQYVAVDPNTSEHTALTTGAEITAAKQAEAEGVCTVEIVEAGTYDGPVSGATALLAKYPDTCKENEVRYFKKTITPADPTDDSGWENAVTFRNLPVNLNVCGTGRWNGKACAVEYYIKETDPFAGGNDSSVKNPYIYGVESADDTEGDLESSHTTLRSADPGIGESDQTVTVKNKLKKRDIEVTKVWEDNGYGPGLHYDIDFTLTGTGSASFSYSYNKTKTLAAGDTSSKVTFSGLPIYGKDGAALSFTVTESVHDESAAVPVHSRYGYVESQAETHFNDDPSDYMTGITVTNTLPVVHLYADKYWEDNNNQDGKRPEQLDFYLDRTAGNVTDRVTFPNNSGTADRLSDGSAAHAADSTGTRWSVDFGVQPRFNAENVEFAYSVTEAASGDKTLAQLGYFRNLVGGSGGSGQSGSGSSGSGQSGSGASGSGSGQSGSGSSGSGSGQSGSGSSGSGQSGSGASGSGSQSDSDIARIGGTGYESLSAALQAAQDGDEIVLLKDVTVSQAVEIPEGKKVALNLGGHVLTSESGKDAIYVMSNADLTLKNGRIEAGYDGVGFGRAAVNPKLTIKADVEINAPNDAAVFSWTGKDGSITIEGGSFTAGGNAVILLGGNVGYGGNTVTINGGVFNGSMVQAGIDAGYIACGLYAPNKDTVTVKNAVFNITGGAGIVQRGGTVYVGDGVVINTTGAAGVTGKVGDSRVVVPCAALVYDSAANYWGQDDSSVMNVMGGEFTSEPGVDAISIVRTDSRNRFHVTGGTFSSDVPEEFIADNYIRENVGEGGSVKTAVHMPNTIYETDITEITEADVDGDGRPDKTFHFRNKRTPKTDGLEVKKVWDDTAGGVDFSGWTRPEYVTVTLQYINAQGNAVSLSEADSTDPVRKLFAGDYVFTRTIRRQDTGGGVDWLKLYGDLPVNVNLTGTEVFNGDSAKIVYAVSETALPGHTPSYSASTKQNGAVVDLPGTSIELNGTSEADRLTVTNTLKYKTVKVRKQWADNYSGDQAQHYDVNLKLESDTAGYPYVKNETIAQSGNASADGTVSDTVDFIVPEYLPNGNAASFTVTELSGDRKYGYVTSYSDYSSSAPSSGGYSFNAADISDGAVITITNTLPLTEVSVSKTWDDESDLYNLRPEEVLMQLERRSVTNNGVAWASADAGWTRCGQKATINAPDAQGNTWSYTFANLPKFDENNIQYEYRVAEDRVNAYDTAYLNVSGDYQGTPVVMQDSDDNDNSSLGFNVKNTLIKKPVTLIKVWDDSGCTQADLHYPVTFTVSREDAGGQGGGQNGGAGDGSSASTFPDKEFLLDITKAHTTGTANIWQRSTEALPVYDKDGSAILYTVKETETSLVIQAEPEPVTVTYTGKYGYEVKQPAANASGDSAYTTNGTHSGYNNYHDSYTITNKLPVTEVTAAKNWAGDLELYPKDAAAVKVSLQRRAENGTEETVEAGRVIPNEAGVPGSVSFRNLPVFDADNNAYAYEIIESPVPDGYTSSVSPANATAEKNNETGEYESLSFTVTNTPIKGSAAFVKFDNTDYQEYHGEDGFTLRTIPNAVFELHRVREDLSAPQKDMKIKFIQQGSSYSMTGRVDGTENPPVDGVVPTSGTEGTRITSDAYGRIQLSGLEPNSYYLTEVAAQPGSPSGAPAGYQETSRHFEFTVGLNDAKTEAKVTYTSVQRVSDKNGTVYGLPNDENLSKLTLTKVDKTDRATLLPNAVYSLLRLRRFDYRDNSAVGSNESEYLSSALVALTEDGSQLNTYWKNVGTYVTGADGKLVAQNQMFGIYAFYEVKAPTGYDRDFAHNEAVVSDTAQTALNIIGPVEINKNNAVGNGADRFSLTHLEPRSKANIKILKTNERGDPLRGAIFDLYWQQDPSDPTSDVRIAEGITTGYDGMNISVTRVTVPSGLGSSAVSVDPGTKAIILDPAEFGWDSKFYFAETGAPIGYAANNSDNDAEKYRISFTLTKELAEETLHIERANDSRLRGEVTLTKTAAAPASSVSFHDLTVGAPLPGAGFKLYQKQADGQYLKLNLYPHTEVSTNGRYRVFYNGVDDETTITQLGFDTAAGTTDIITTGTDGKLRIEGMLWGDYFIKESVAPTGFALPEVSERGIYFSVGRNNTSGQQLTMQNIPETASLNIVKHIDTLNIEAWGEPVFIFKLRQTEYYSYSSGAFVPIDSSDQPVWTKTVKVKTRVTQGGATGYEDATGEFDIEPGTYVITEFKVARYVTNGASMTDNLTEAPSTGTVTPVSNGTDEAVIKVTPGGRTQVTFKNKLDNYEKQGHSDLCVNEFNGYKAFRVDDRNVREAELSPQSEGSSTYVVSIPKSALNPRLVKADGTEIAVEAAQYGDITVSHTSTDPDHPEITVESSGESGISIKAAGRIEDILGSVYTLTASYGGFTTSFELRFEAKPVGSKTERRVVFLTDDDNVSYYEDGGKNNVYTLILIKSDDGVQKVLHNGTAITASASSIPAPVIDPALPGYTFVRWEYSIAKESDPDHAVSFGDALNNNSLYGILTGQSNPESLIITVKPILSPPAP